VPLDYLGQVSRAELETAITERWEELDGFVRALTPDELRLQVPMDDDGHD
jgi:hypothetical protein